MNLVDLRDSDLPFLTELLNREGIREQLFCEDRPLRQEQISEFLYHTEPGTQAHVFGIIEAEEMVGCIAINNVHPRTRSGNITHMALSQWKYALESVRQLVEYGFNTLNLNRIECRAYADNRVTPLLCRKMGGTIEGAARQAAYRKGEYVDIVVWSLLKSEWSNGRPGS